MQVTFTAFEVSLAERIFYVVIWPLAWAILKFTTKQAVVKAEKELNRIVTDNSNRIRDEIMVQVEDKFESHETNAFARIAAIEKHLKELGDVLREKKDE